MKYRVCEKDSYDVLEIEADNPVEAVDKAHCECGWESMDVYQKIEDDWIFDGNFTLVREVKTYDSDR